MSKSTSHRAIAQAAASAARLAQGKPARSAYAIKRARQIAEANQKDGMTQG